MDELGSRRLPAVDAVLRQPAVKALVLEYGRELVVAAVRETLRSARQAARGGGPLPTKDMICDRVARQLAEWCVSRPQPVVNATGVILHTNLGRAPVSAAAAEAMARTASSYSDLEYDLVAGHRGSRHAQLEPLLRRITGAEAALAVNNNAAATLLVVSALAAGRKVIVSRGQLIEIGGSYRLPEVLKAGGAELVEVGTTNRTYVADYEAAIDETTGLILRVHQSNYRVVGFACQPALVELASLAHRHGLPLVDDLGSGALIDTRQFGLAYEPLVADSLAAGADLVTFSGDKLLGGPQAGLVVGRKELVDCLRRHPLARAVRPGKDVIAGLHATLMHYARSEAIEVIPVWRMIAASPQALADRAAAWCKAVSGAGFRARLLPGESTVGGGSLPGECLATTLLAVPAAAPDQLASALRRGTPPVIARLGEDQVLLDPRTVQPGEDEMLVQALLAALRARPG